MGDIGQMGAGSELLLRSDVDDDDEDEEEESTDNDDESRPEEAEESLFGSCGCLRD